MPRKIAFIGLGRMGAPMASRLVAAGHDVTVFNRTSSKADPLVSAGARRADTPAVAAKGCEIAITMVEADKDVREVILGPEGAVHGLARGAVVVDCTTTSPDTAREIGQALSERGMGFLDAPVTGLDIGARNGTLSIMVGGAEEHLERVREVLEVLGRKITRFGPNGAGQTAKACNQILCAVNMVGIVEALHLARLNGLDLNGLIDALAPGAGGSWAFSTFAPRIAAGDFAPGGRLALMIKDLRIIGEAAGRVGLPVDGCRVALRLFEDNAAHGESDDGTQAMYKALSRSTN